MAAENWKDSNLAGIGSDLDKNLRKLAAESEEEFHGAGKKVGVEVWRIEKFEAVKIKNEKELGVWHRGDSYIVLQTYKEGSELKWNLYYFLGSQSTQDEMGSAAILTINLDDMLGTKPIQFREVEGSESDAFKKLFSQFILVDGGVDSGFTKPVKESFTPKLFQVSKVGSDLQVSQVPIEVASLNQGDCFILDMGMKLYQWNSPGCRPTERMAAATVLENICSLRDGEPEEEVFDGEDVFSAPAFWEPFGNTPSLSDIKEAQPRAPVDDDTGIKRLYKLSNEGGEMKCTLVQEVENRDLDVNLIEEDEIMIATKGSKAYCYVGYEASREERFYMNFHASKLLEQCGLGYASQVVTVRKGNTTKDWDNLFA
eukprot:CAMPEP_0184692016 /NCGR_PEP_ID=MMETSP0313-20130426/668_1 /TAXON_ID=2792 /ORGANISM="Porphyridium aerugineum, Strain SAG 1380-2" /LENGTH=369 /DNA_ID=CAMNT_0027149811 /DNA_START=144 /DNA_END=1253 /DNA_ORIENTATION=+